MLESWDSAVVGSSANKDGLQDRAIAIITAGAFLLKAHGDMRKALFRKLIPTSQSISIAFAVASTLLMCW